MAASYVAVGTAMDMITVSRCPAKKNPAANDPPPPRRVLSERRLRLAQACGMLRFSGRSGVEGGGILHCDLATQEALRRLGERALFWYSPGLLEQGADPGRTAAHHRSQHPSIYYHYINWLEGYVRWLLVSFLDGGVDHALLNLAREVSVDAG